MADQLISDPMEMAIAAALTLADIEFEHEKNGLDFYLPSLDLYIEVKRFHSDRIAGQMARADNVIAVQGVKSVAFITSLIARLSPTASGFIGG